MNKHMRLLICGIGLSVTLLIVGYGISNHLEKRLTNLKNQCAEKGRKTNEAARKDGGPPDGWEIICDPVELANDQNLVGVQKEISITYSRRELLRAPGVFIPLAILIISFIPWCWYFLLDRIKELREAVVGK